MISSRGLFHNDEKTQRLININEKERPISIQIFGNSPDMMGKAAKEVAKLADIVDINMGCPAPKIVKNGDGSKLLLDLELVEKIVKEVVSSVDVPVTVKMRTGWDKDNIVAVDAAKVIERAGAAAITIHGRTRDQYYGGKVDLDSIKQVKESVNIPVIGNGDIKSSVDAIKMLEYTGVDGIMIGRGILGNPWLLEEIETFLKEGKIQESPSKEERLRVIIEHLKMAVEEKGEYIAIREMRKHICWYIKSLKDSSKIRQVINHLETKEDVIDCLIEYFKTI